jgi:hypothetical protein
VGGVLDVGFPRPRRRGELLEAAEYYVLRERLIGFLAEEDPKRRAA